MLKKGRSRHSQISDWIKTRIEKGIYEVDEKLPSENELASKFDVSRVTVRRALQTLEGEGVIYRSQGLGSFVSDRRSRQTLVRLTDFSEDMTRAGMQASSVVVGFEQLESAGWLDERLQIKEGNRVTRIDRLRLGDQEPIAFDITWLPLFYGQLLDGYDLQEKTIYGIFEEEYEIPIVRGNYRIQAENADDYLADQLKVKEGTALLLIDRQSFTVQDKPVYYQKRYYRNDKVIYELLLERESEDTDLASDLPLKEFVPVFNRNK